MRAHHTFKDPAVLFEADEIMALFRFYKADSNLYLERDEADVKELFRAVVMAINSCSVLKPHLPYMEFVVPSRKFLEDDMGWVGHFEERDNRTFFLSDVHDFLRLMIGRKTLE